MTPRELRQQIEASGRPALIVVDDLHWVDVLDAALGALRSHEEDGDAGSLDPTVFKRTVRYAWTRRIARRLARTGTCPLCLLLKRIQETLGYQLLELLRCPEARALYGARAALCLPNFRWAIDRAADKDLLDRLIDVERTRLECLARDERNGDWSSALVTHMYELAHGFHEKNRGDALFLPAGRQADGARTFKLIEGEPLPTSFGEDLYNGIFTAGIAHRVTNDPKARATVS